MKRVKLHGAFRVGSNYLQTLLELNYDASVVNGYGGFKHLPVPALFKGREWVPPENPILGIVKDPRAWLVSMWRYVNGVGRQHVSFSNPWSRFLESPLIVSFGGRPDFPEQRFASPADYWNAMAHNMLSIGAFGLVVRYENSLRDPEKVCARSADRFDLVRRQKDFVKVEHRTLNMADRQRSKPDDYTTGERFDSKYYVERRYIAEFNWHDRRLVRSQLDKGLMTRLGY